MKETLTSKILQFLKENPGATIKEVAVALEISQDLARRIMYRLKNKGFIEKSGDGYVLSSKGAWFLEDILKPKREHEKIRESEEKPPIHTFTPIKEESFSEEQILSKIDDLMNKVKQFEEQLTEFKEELESLKKKIGKLKKPERVVTKRLHKPVVSIQEAVATYGGLLESMRSEGSVVLIGSLAVDKDFYEEFRKKFPMPVEDKEKLSEYEQALLEEMIKDARVIVSGGRIYKLIG